MPSESSQGNSKMRKLLAAATALAAVCVATSANAIVVTPLHYTFSSGSFFDSQSASPPATVSGSFDFDPTTGLLSNVDYTSTFGHYTTGAEYNPGDATQIFFGTFGTPNYDVYQLASSLINGGTVVINSGTNPNIYINAGGSLTTGGVPEAATWAMMIVGFGLVGGAMRSSRRRTKVSYAIA